MLRGVAPHGNFDLRLETRSRALVAASTRELRIGCALESRLPWPSMDFTWWQNGVVYQIYPRSFMDSSGDGVGDLRGIEARLDHLAWLGVDAIWLSPCFPSPMADFGYDVSDYCDIDPIFGDLAAFDALLAAAHARGIRVVLDWVPNHTSDQHPWFVESRAGRASPKRDWYVWRDPKPGGAPPNDWKAIFGGSAWEWDEASGQFYLHSFLKEQPELDWRNPEVVKAMHGTLRFWLDRGVDGFRIDVVHRLAKDPELRDTPEDGCFCEAWGGEKHIHAENHPDIHELLRGVRGVLDEYEGRMAVGEVYLMNPAEVARYYGKGDELHLAFNFSFLHSPWSAERFGSEVERMEGFLQGGGWPTVVLSNHDVPRHAHRYDHAEHGEARARVAALMLLTLRGTPFLYYGEEIGMRNTPIPRERLQDPLAFTLHPNLSRDGERTPMQWQALPGAGFTRGAPWLPIGDAGARNVAAQREDPRSLLHLYRELLALRRATPALHAGSFRRLEAPEGVLAFERRAGDERALVALNFAGEPRELRFEDAPVRRALSTDPERALPERSGSAALGPSEGLLLLLA
jgi:alpha-glucosidase